MIKDFLAKAERLGYVSGQKIEMTLVDSETNEVLKPFKQKHEENMAKTHQQAWLEAIDSLKCVIADTQSTD